MQGPEFGQPLEQEAERERANHAHGQDFANTLSRDRIQGARRGSAAAIIEQQTFRSFETYIVVTIIYLILALALKAVLSWFGRLVFPKVSGIVYRQMGAGA